jgi:hypothetical protein
MLDPEAQSKLTEILRRIARHLLELADALDGKFANDEQRTRLTEFDGSPWRAYEKAKDVLCYGLADLSVWRRVNTDVPLPPDYPL